MSRQQAERNEQAAVFAWAGIMASRYPDLVMLHCIPNGSNLKGGFTSNVVQIVNAQRAGVKKGVPDICLPVPRGGFAGMYVEMKRYMVRLNKTKPPTRTPTKTTEEQDWWHGMLRSYGYHVVVCWSAEEAQAAITAYLDQPSTQGLCHG